jgi:hypothetical protein
MSSGLEFRRKNEPEILARVVLDAVPFLQWDGGRLLAPCSVHRDQQECCGRRNDSEAWPCDQGLEYH